MGGARVVRGCEGGGHVRGWWACEGVVGCERVAGGGCEGCEGVVGM